MITKNKFLINGIKRIIKNMSIIISPMPIRSTTITVFFMTDIIILFEFNFH